MVSSGLAGVRIFSVYHTLESTMSIICRVTKVDTMCMVSTVILKRYHGHL